MTESLYLRARAENLHLFACRYELHATNPTNSPTAGAAYEKAAAALTDAYLALIGAADELDDQLLLPFSRMDVRAVVPVRVVAIGISKESIG